jgi:hypothetical protein
MTFYELIEKWKLNRNLLASKMEMSKATFNNKLSPDYYGNFTEPEKQKLIGILNEMRNDMNYLPSLSGTTDNFNEALKLITQKEV